MKVLLLFLGLLFAAKAEMKNDLVRQNLKGRVKRVTHCQFPVVNGHPDTVWSTTYIFSYDENGNQVTEEDYTGGSLLSGFTTLNHRRLYQYDDLGNQTVVLEYNDKGQLTQKVLYHFDSAGRRTARYNLGADGRIWRWSVFKYNDRGLQCGVDKYSADSMLIEQLTYHYDTKGNLAEELLYIDRFTDTVGVRRAGSPDSAKVMRLDYMKQYTYDDSGKKMTEFSNLYGSSFPFITVFSYAAYDTAGNWQQETLRENGKVTSIVDRIIDYY
jgi:hypothetical protein